MAKKLHTPHHCQVGSENHALAAPAV